MTGYIVLQQNGDAWMTNGPPVESASAEAAIRKTITAPGTYVAIPVRSFSPVTVTVETREVVKLTENGATVAEEPLPPAA